MFYQTPINLQTEYSNRALQQMVDFIYKYKFSPKEITDYDDFSAYINGYENTKHLQ